MLPGGTTKQGILGLFIVAEEHRDTTINIVVQNVVIMCTNVMF